MGDLNSTWQASDRSAVDRLAHALGLRTFAIDRNQAPTFGRRRIDWILVTPPIAFAQRHALTQDVLSDHRAVIIDLVVEG
jgi:endonuclease/exonuclease/phosphatase family metal-dependent hydrolase